MSKRGVQAYAQEVKLHCANMNVQLDSMKAIAQQRALTEVENYALERMMQLSIEAAIGLAKHWVKQEVGQAPGEAYAAFEQLKKLAAIDSDELALWHSIVGMRNTLVHDYLDVDRNILLKVLMNGEYEALFQFAYKAIDGLLKA
jgi:uncharacterized protein YutE (UPF0331/DUF86 family)